MAQVNVRIDDDIKIMADSACKEMGLSLSVALNMCARKIAYERRIPFDVACSDPFWSEENIARLKKSIAQIEAGEGTIHEVDYDGENL
ncbi:MAG: type II toxin-antitoxin system RelB/DinJ family antitoxin [Clostridia bacterium]|nr:type II toxin-antitoxin system RelB/DinJ family antitoxin [Clostridia bacterium]